MKDNTQYCNKMQKNVVWKHLQAYVENKRLAAGLNQRKSVTSMSGYWNPKPTPKHKPVPISEMKMSFSNVRKKKRKVTPYDNSWIDSFDPRPMKQRRETTFQEKMDFATKLRKIDPCSGILDFLPSSKDLIDNNENSA